MLKRSVIILLAAVFAFNCAFAQLKHSKKSAHPSYKGLLMAGYQGWHDTPTDGAKRGWGHYLQTGVFGPGNLKIDIWPELAEYKKMYPTPFKHADSTVAMLPSDHDYSTTQVRFKWMKDYGVDGVFMQRFIGNTRPGPSRDHFNKVLGDGLKAARKYGRAIAVMYDFSGMRADTSEITAFKKDWKNLVDSMKITSGGNNQPYLYHNGKPLVVLWGVGFNDSGRRYTTATVSKIVDFLQHDPVYGGCAVMLGVPTYWREFGSDTEKNPALHDLIKKVDVIHPWTVGRYGSDAAFLKYNEIEKGDIAWCKENHVDYAPTCFPGFSWHNLNLKSPFNQIKRDKGNFFWNQLSAAINNGAQMIYVAMFDEVDEGTAIMKVSQNPPVGPSPFLTFEEGIPSDYYLYLAGYAGSVLKNKVPLPASIPLPKSAKSAIKK